MSSENESKYVSQEAGLDQQIADLELGVRLCHEEHSALQNTLMTASSHLQRLLRHVSYLMILYLTSVICLY